VNIETAKEVPAESDAYLIVANDQDQYSAWPAQRKLPAGWHILGDPAPQESCLDRIETLWTDMRPGSPRQAPGEAEPSISSGDNRGGACM
jgi:MbtH protein